MEQMVKLPNNNKRLTLSPLAASLALMLSACGTLPQGVQLPGPEAPAPVRETQSEEQRRAEAAGQAQTAAAAAAVDNGINREGRIIQFGRSGESAPEFEVPDNDVVELNFEQEDLRLVLEQLGSALGLSMVIDPTIDTKVSLRTAPNAPLSYEDVWPLMRLLARNAGVTIERNGSVYEFKRNASTIPSEIALPGWLDETSASTVLQVTPLTYISAEAAEALLRPMLQPEGSVLRLGPANILGVSGSASQLERINNLLSVIDDDPFQNQGIQLYELLNSRASDVAEELQEVLKLIEGEQPSYQVLGLDRINAVLVVAPATRGFDEVTRWMRILDAESQEQVEQLFVYRVKNLKAESLAETLTNVYDTDDDRERNDVRENGQAGLDAEVPEGQAQAFTTLGGGGLLAAIANNAQQEGVASANITVTIVSDEETNSLLIRATPREYRQLLTTISSLDRITPQVMINAVIGQVTLTEGTRFGIDWTSVAANLGSGSSRIGTRFIEPTLFNTNGEQIPGSGLVFTRSFQDGSAVIDATLNALAKDNEVSLLARPTILTTNNKEGSIHVGQSVPVNNGTTVTVNGQTENIAYQNVGVDLVITPQINDDGFIRMEIEQKLSSVEDGAGETVGNNPVFTDQEIITSVVVADQNTIVLGGLIREEDSDNQSGIPGLQKIPVVGRAFSYTDRQQSRRELFVILRPQIIYGDARDTERLREFRESFSNVSVLLQEAGL